MAERMKKILEGYIGEDQTDFVPGQQIRENLRMVLNILELRDKTPWKKLGFFFLDAEKAFDNVNWRFMKSTLGENESWQKYMNVINNIYSTQKTAIRINNEITEEFPVQKGTRQGCPISPILFILVIEILLSKTQKDKQYSGIKVKK